MRLKVDENLPASVVDLLKGGGHDVATVFDEQLGGADDARVIAAATVENRALITLDKDFADMRNLRRIAAQESSSYAPPIKRCPVSGGL